MLILCVIYEYISWSSVETSSFLSSILIFGHFTWWNQIGSGHEMKSGKGRQIRLTDNLFSGGKNTCFTCQIVVRNTKGRVQ